MGPHNRKGHTRRLMKTIYLYGVDSCIRRRCYRIDRLQKDAVQGKVMVALLLFSQAVEIGAPQAPSVSRAGRQEAGRRASEQQQQQQQQRRQRAGKKRTATHQANIKLREPTVNNGILWKQEAKRRGPRAIHHPRSSS